MNAHRPIRADQQGDYASMSDDEKRAALKARIAAFEAEHPRPASTKERRKVSRLLRLNDRRGQSTAEHMCGFDPAWVHPDDPCQSKGRR